MGILVLPGINLADEYINAIDILGHWKDTAIMIKGGVYNLTIMFLPWDYLRGVVEDYEQFKPKYYLEKQYATDGYVHPLAITHWMMNLSGNRIFKSY